MQHLGLIAILVSLAGMAYLLTRWRGTKDMSMSLHAASARAAFVWFGVVLTVTGGLWYWFMLGWFVPRLMLGPEFVAVLSLAVLGMLGAAWVPDVPGWMRRLHRWAAYGMAVLFMPMVALVVADPVAGVVARYLDGVILAYMMVSFALITRFKRVRPYYLPLQVSYVVVFEVAILAATYLR